MILSQFGREHQDWKKLVKWTKSQNGGRGSAQTVVGVVSEKLIDAMLFLRSGTQLYIKQRAPFSHILTNFPNIEVARITKV